MLTITTENEIQQAIVHSYISSYVTWLSASERSFFSGRDYDAEATQRAMNCLTADEEWLLASGIDERDIAAISDFIDASHDVNHASAGQRNAYADSGDITSEVAGYFSVRETADA